MRQSFFKLWWNDLKNLVGQLIITLIWIILVLCHEYEKLGKITRQQGERELAYIDTTADLRRTLSEERIKVVQMAGAIESIESRPVLKDAVLRAADKLPAWRFQEYLNRFLQGNKIRSDPLHDPDDPDGARSRYGSSNSPK